MSRFSVRAAVAIGGLCLVACGAGAGTPNAVPSKSSCAERTSRARSDVLAVVAGNRACTHDADCASVAVGSACFDACTRAVNAAGVQAVHDAEARVDAGVCAGFARDGCRFDVPPCAPPTAPRCNNGLCE